MMLLSSALDAGERGAGLQTSFWTLVSDIAAVHGTPFYAYFPHRAKAAFQALALGAAPWGIAHVAYSVKTNPLHALLRDLSGSNAFAEVASVWEFRQARAAGFPAERIVFNGPLKSEPDLREVLTTPPFTLNVDSLDELTALERALGDGREPVAVGLRVCPPKANGAWSRFGLELATGELSEAIARCVRNASLRLACIHFHLGTQLETAERYVEVVEIARGLWATHAFRRSVCLDIGGGFPYDHSALFEDQSFDAMRFFAALSDAWGAPPRPTLIIEPGRFIAAPAMAVISRVLSRKPRFEEPTIVVLDSGTNHNVMAAFYEHLWSFESSDPEIDYRFCGPLCMEDDILSGSRHSRPPAPQVLVAMLNAGAYSLSLARSFIQARPPIFQVNGSGTYEQLELRETFDEIYGSGASLSRYGVGR